MTRRIRIVSWNIRKAVGLDWRRDPARILRVLNRLAADIVILQEADRRLPPRPPALPPDSVRAAGWSMIDADPDTPSIGHHGNAVLLGRVFTLDRLQAIDLPGLEPRGAVLARCTGCGGSLTIGALHLGLRHKDRLQQMAHVLRTAEAFEGPVLLGGDLNEWRPGRSLLPAGSPWRAVLPGPSFHASRPSLRLDRFVVSPDLIVRDSGVATRQMAERASDHLPVWIEIEGLA
ncbi:endonuclease/exonuclease/phosphatase family protein [Jannaschia sp. 2305UL9-9]|uniref:endonuclease/exonuclease/phosphatase family protein n=1 Tax=Jannaschia sp. 2305UL9-9 TaxID=3121638 RepID=UPI003528A4F4